MFKISKYVFLLYLMYLPTRLAFRLHAHFVLKEKYYYHSNSLFRIGLFFNVIRGVWIHVFTFMFSYFTSFFKNWVPGENTYCKSPAYYKYVQ